MYKEIETGMITRVTRMGLKLIRGSMDYAAAFTSDDIHHEAVMCHV